jgi:glycosyltransferase involved in cell wall biosynthesis
MGSGLRTTDDTEGGGACVKSAIKVMKFTVSFGVAGSELQCVNLGLALDPSRFTVHFGCLRRWGGLLHQIDARTIPVFAYDISSLRQARTVAAQFRLARDIRRTGIQIVHTYNFYTNVFAIPAARLAGARVVASIRDMGVYLSSRQRQVQRHICRLADQILVNANAIKEWLVSDGYDARRIAVIPNAVDLARFERNGERTDVRRELGLPPNAPLVGVVGRVKQLKGIEDFLSAAAIVGRRFPAAHFVIIGEGLELQDGVVVQDDVYRQKLDRQVVELGLQDRVTFTGFRADVDRILPELSVSVLPSLSEGLSNALLESLAAGVPVVATRVGGTAEVVRDGENGLLVPAGDAASIANAIHRVLEAPAFAQRVGQQGRSSVERFSIHRVVESTSELYESLAEGAA